mgnify:CR=1 FL=1|tara:strand:- start:20 stop:196 length:177 start_codon:yes stop_codon:yes gene_type:complete
MIFIIIMQVILIISIPMFAKILWLDISPEANVIGCAMLLVSTAAFWLTIQTTKAIKNK